VFFCIYRDMKLATHIKNFVLTAIGLQLFSAVACSQAYAQGDFVKFITPEKKLISFDSENSRCLENEKKPLNGKLPNFKKKHKPDCKLKASGNSYTLSSRHNFTNVKNFSAQPRFCYASDRVWFLMKTNLAL